MLGTANIIKTKIIERRDSSLLQDALNTFITGLGEREVISIQYQIKDTGHGYTAMVVYRNNIKPLI